ncbi:hypothetical protein DRQ53_10825 [bacterium]|nr:MAG: hypothetical protein DRQ32_08175 [bacterium]RKZ14734.1 MAG: hypothetical protein DRQ53_10825 [bacterium]
MRNVLVLICILSASFATASLAQVDPPATTYCWLQATGDPAGTQLTLEVGINDTLDPEVSGFDIYRSINGTCAEAVRITDEPLPRGLVGVHEFYLVDEGAASSATEYIYRVEVVDQDRNFLDGWLEFDYFEGIAFATFGGTPLLGVGTIEDGLTFARDFIPCEPTCFNHIFIEPGNPLIEPYVDTGITVAIYGTTWCNFEGCFANVSFVAQAACEPVPTRTESWSSLKAKFD